MINKLRQGSIGNPLIKKIPFERTCKTRLLQLYNSYFLYLIQTENNVMF